MSKEKKEYKWITKEEYALKYPCCICKIGGQTTRAGKIYCIDCLQKQDGKESSNGKKNGID